MRQLPRILVIGPRRAFGPIVTALEMSRRYRFDYAPDPDAAQSLVKRKPDSILLGWPAEPEASDRVLTWLQNLREQTAVVVMSSQPDMASYLAAMESGAFDYLTTESPFEEVIRVLENAVRWSSRRAA